MDNVFKKRGNMGYGKVNLLFTLARVPIIYIDPYSPIYTSCTSPPPKEVYAKIPHYVAYTPLYAHSLYYLSRYSKLVYIELSYCFVPTVVLKKERSELRD